MNSKNINTLSPFVVLIFAGILTALNEDISINNGISSPYNIYFGVGTMIIGVLCIFSYYLLFIKK